MLTSRLLLVICFAFTLVGCGGPKLNALGADDVIVAFGDSLTAGVGTSLENSYPSVLADLSGINVVNAGVSGETTSEGLVRLPEVLAEHNPSLLILLEGGNDILQNQNSSRIQQNLERMVQIAFDRGVPVVLIGVPEKSLFSNAAPFYRDLAEKYDLVFDEGVVASLMRSPSKKSDAVHFNAEGYADMAAEIYALLSNNGAFN